MGCVKIIDAKEKTDSTRELLPDHAGLMVAVCASEENAGLASDRPDDDPALRTAIVRERWHILYKLEAEHINEEVDRRIVVPHDEGEEMEMRHHCSGSPD